MSRFVRSSLTALAALPFLVALSGCAGTVSLEPADAATDPGCAEIMVRLPDTVADQQRRETNAQATAAWGDPAAVLLRCGVEGYGPTTLPCVSIDGVDWVEDDSQAPSYRYVTYGRTPATEVILDSGAVSGTSTLVDLGGAVESVPQERVCTGAEDVFGTHAPTED